MPIIQSGLSVVECLLYTINSFNFIQGAHKFNYLTDYRQCVNSDIELKVEEPSIGTQEILHFIFK